MGQYLAKQTIDDWLQEHVGEMHLDNGVDLETFTKLVTFLRSKSLETWRETYGFSKEQVESFKKYFCIACEDNQHGKQVIALNRVQTVMERLGYMGNPKIQGNALLNALARVTVHHVDRGELESLSFEDFLLLVRHLENEKNLAELKDEEVAIKMSGLDADAVKLFREAFNSCPKNDRGAVAQKEIKIMLSRFQIIKTQEQRKQLNKLMEDHDEFVTFALFLGILRSLEHCI